MQTPSLFSSGLLQWYRINKRSLPWRETKDPYKVWLSEIILQQTRVAQGLPYYREFVKIFPTVHHLAKAPEQKVLLLWQGLGYYSRARNLHATARHLVKEHKGIFPDQFEQLKKLKGIGDYTAAAISSICFNRKHAVVDGNVYRVLSRIFAIDTAVNSTDGKKQFKALAQELIPEKSPGDYNQAIMEFGATFCVPANPDCHSCIFLNSCAAGSTGQAHFYPKKISQKKISARYFDFFALHYKNKVYIEKRKADDIWKNLYQFPLIENLKHPSRVKIERSLCDSFLLKDKAFKIKAVHIPKKHLLSHQEILARFWLIELKKPLIKTRFKLIPLTSLKNYPFPVIMSNYLNEISTFEKTLS